jgi:hypothetical protein
VRTNAEEYNFFKTGRVFAMLWAEKDGETVSGTVTKRPVDERNPKAQGSFNQTFYFAIRRFVVIRVNRNKHHVKAW